MAVYNSEHKKDSKNNFNPEERIHEMAKCTYLGVEYDVDVDEDKGMTKCPMCGRMYDIEDTDNYIASLFGQDEVKRIVNVLGRHVCDSCMLGVHYSSEQSEGSDEEILE